MNHNSIFMGSSVRYNLNERVPDYDREQENLSKAADEAFRVNALLPPLRLSPMPVGDPW